ncbi:hypothetical protein E2562_009887 [Oryza meyeriana var. granulata]|uniref:Uncharacterized protein n=1 Tax=Oryza meyeriana var. granulata TaxID=110450 RepID=A0A6G1BUZ0_9ORYZ|nr:hypothetical protein E2562_009887 [Oryza meyeriana var. granulata]
MDAASGGERVGLLASYVTGTTTCHVLAGIALASLAPAKLPAGCAVRRRRRHPMEVITAVPTNLIKR